MSDLASVYVALGSNLEDPIAQVNQALSELSQLPHTRLIAHSRLYRSAPVGHLDQPPFINAVAHLESALAPGALLDQLLLMEQRHGRRRLFLNGPRTLDLDILMHGTRQLHQDHLTLPHPRLAERAFVLVPWLEIAPGTLLIPGLGTLTDLAARCSLADIFPLNEN